MKMFIVHLRRFVIERDLVLPFSHEVVGGLVAFARADRLTERDPRIVERIFAGECEFLADGALIDRDCRLFAETVFVRIDWLIAAARRA